MITKIKVLVVDDSAFMRKAISLILEDDPEIEVVGTCRDGSEGFEAAKRLSPDIITLDIEMPRMDGLTALKLIMKECPTSVIMLSSLTTQGAEVTIKALELGAVDFLPKGQSYVNLNIVKIKAELINKVKTIVKHKRLRERLSRLQKLQAKNGGEKHTYRTQSRLPQNDYKAIALGISTGGPMALQRVIPKISEDINLPIFLVQHMPPKFTKSLADRLNSMSQITVKEAEDYEIVKPGVAYLAPGGYHMTLDKNASGNILIKISDLPINTLHRPSVDVMISSVIKIYGRHTLGVIMTGMGRDGSLAIKELKNIGGYCIAQSEESCVVYGMPKAIVDAGMADVIAPLDNISQLINSTKQYVRQF